MLYLDYSRKAGEWVPNIHGGNENLGAIYFLLRLNEEVYRQYPDVQTIAEESTAWPGVSRPTSAGGLGFGMKWDMGWMHDTLRYFSHDPIHRQYHHNELLFRMIYAFSENYVLPLSHDEVVHGKGSLLASMPGDDWQKFANLRLLYGYMFGQPGKKLLFMGGEWGQGPEWSHDTSLDWHQLEHPLHAGVQGWVADLNRLYRNEPALHDQDCNPFGFQWIDYSDSASSVISFLRKGAFTGETILVVCNFTPVPRREHPVGVPFGGFWEEMLNSDASHYGGSGIGNCGGLCATATPCHGQPYSLTLAVPPLGVIFLKGKAQCDTPV
jgi:1,4-alpha-glucan branching enzyme